MANRSIQAKVVKLKRALRAAPRRYNANLTHIGQQPLREHITDASKRAVVIPQAILKRTTSIAEAEQQARMLFLEAMFPSMFGYQNNKPKQYAEKLRATLKDLATALGDIPIQQNITLVKTENIKLMLFFDASKTKYLFVHLDMVAQVVRVSLNYGSRDRAYDVFRRRTIQYKKPLSFKDESVAKYVT